MIPDVPRSLREQLKKENMALMEFLLEQDQEACAKTLSKKHSTPYFPANVDIVVEEAPEEENVCQVEQKEEEVRIEISLDEPRGFDTNPEVYKPFEEAEHDREDEPKVEECDEVGNVGSKEKEENGEVSEDNKGEKEESRKNNEVETNDTEGETFTVDLDSFMRGLGLLGKRRKFSF